MNDIPRRNRLDLNTPVELAIRDAVNAVETVGAHPLLTEAVILLGQAREKVADYIDRESDVVVSRSDFVRARHLADPSVCAGPGCPDCGAL